MVGKETTPKLWLPDPGETVRVSVSSEGEISFSQNMAMSLQPVAKRHGFQGAKEVKNDAS